MKKLPAEWEHQSKVLITFPHKDSDWNAYLEDITKSYIDIINTIARYQKILVLCDNKKRVKSYFEENENIEFVKIKTNDTWIRDYGVITLFNDNQKELYNFTFNAWGDKFNSSLDDKVNKKLYKKGFFEDYKLIDKNFILEGGSIDSNGEGVLLTTTKSLLNKNRNNGLTKKQIEKKLKKFFSLERVLWLESGHLVGDDTDAHIDTLARFIDKDTIAYVKCYDKDDKHFKELQKMEEELKTFGFNLLPLPLPSKKIYNKERLPATYLNFLFVNNAIIVPIYNDLYDDLVLKIMQYFFQGKREVVGVDASVLIREHGSLHCATMQVH